MSTLDHSVQRLRRAAVVLGLFFVVGRAALAASIPMYTVEWRGDQGGLTAINDLGQVASAIGIAGIYQGSHATLWSPLGEPRDLDTLGGTHSFARAINDAGQVVGNTDPWGHAFFWSPTSGMRDLGTFGGPLSWGMGINNAGQVVGWAEDAQRVGHGFIWTSAEGMRDLGLATGAWDVNDLGQVVGSYIPGFRAGQNPAMGPGHAFLWTPTGGMQDLGTLGQDSYATHINNVGQVVGVWYDGLDHAFLWTPEKGMQDLGALSGKTGCQAWCINDLGQVIGRSFNSGPSDPSAFIYTRETGMVDLNTRIDPDLGIHLMTAWGINNAGQIVAAVMGGTVRLTSDTLPPSTTAVLSPPPSKSGWNSGDVTVTLKAVDNPGGCGAQQITYRASGAQTIASTTASGSSVSLHITALGATTLTFLAQDRAGNQEILKTTRIQIGKPAPPRAPSRLTVSDPEEGGSSHLELAWKVNSDNESGFEIQRKEAGKDWTLVTVAPADTTFYTDSGLDAYTHYTYRVRAVNAGGSSEWSNEASGDTGIRPLVRLVPDHLEFDRQPVGTTSPAQTLLLTNAGNGPLTLESIQITGNGRGEFQVLDGDRPGTLQPGESRTLRVTFTADSTGSWLAALTIQSSAPDSPHPVPLSGAGVPDGGGGPSLKIGVSSLSVPDGVDFGPGSLGTRGALKTLTLTNTGTAPLKIQRIAIAGVNARDFAIVAGGGGGTVPPRASRTLTLRFTPKALGSRSAVLTIRSNADGSPHQMTISGMGAIPTAGEPGREQIPSPTRVELFVAAVDDVPTSRGKVVISAGQCITLKLRVKYRNGAVAELADDPNLQFAAGGASGQFTQTNVWCPQSGDAGRTITLLGRYTGPSGRQLLGKVTLSVRRAAHTHQ